MKSKQDMETLALEWLTEFANRELHGGVSNPRAVEHDFRRLCNYIMDVRSRENTLVTVEMLEKLGFTKREDGNGEEEWYKECSWWGVTLQQHTNHEENGRWYCFICLADNVLQVPEVRTLYDLRCVCHAARVSLEATSC